VLRQSFFFIFWCRMVLGLLPCTSFGASEMVGSALFGVYVVWVSINVGFDALGATQDLLARCRMNVRVTHRCVGVRFQAQDG